MMKTRDVLAYHMATGRDIFDDVAELDSQTARMELGFENSAGLILSLILEGLYIIGMDPDTVELSELLAPTIEPDEDIDEDGPDFIPDEHITLEKRAMRYNKKNVTEKTLTAMILSKTINSDILLDAPYDMTVETLDKAAEEQNKHINRRR